MNATYPMQTNKSEPFCRLRRGLQHRPLDVTGMIRSAVLNAMEAEKRSAMERALN